MNAVIHTSPRFCLQVCKCVLSLQAKIPNPDVSCSVVAGTEFVPDIFEIRKGKEIFKTQNVELKQEVRFLISMEQDVSTRGVKRNLKNF